MPKGFTEWMKGNAERVANAAKAGTLPYFLKDNKWAMKATSPQPSAPQSISISDNEAALEKALGIKKGEPMTFDEANELRGNPHYGEDVSYKINCQCAVVANELRRRGFDVEAMANTGLVGTMPKALSRLTEAAWLDSNGKMPNHIRIESNRNPTLALRDAMSEEGRYHVRFYWTRGEGHIMTAERLPDGKLRYYDPQSGKQGKFEELYDLADITRGSISVLRVDNLKPNPLIVGDAVKPADSSARSLRKLTAEQAEFFKEKGVQVSGLRLTNRQKDELGILKKNAFAEGKFRLRRHDAVLENGGRLRCDKHARDAFTNHVKDEQELAAASEVWDNPTKLKFIRVSELGEGKDMSNPKDVRNIERKKELGVIHFHAYEFKDSKGKRWTIKTEVFAKGREILYSISPVLLKR